MTRSTAGKTVRCLLRIMFALTFSGISLGLIWVALSPVNLEFTMRAFAGHLDVGTHLGQVVVGLERLFCCSLVPLLAALGLFWLAWKLVAHRER